MRRTFIIASVLFSLLLPAIAVAAFTKASDVLEAAQWKGKPMDFSYELHGHMENTYLSAWMKGRGEGTDAASAKADMRLTVDLNAPEDKARARFQLRVLDQTAYVMLESVEGTLDPEWLSESRKAAGKWYSLPLDPSDFTKETLPTDKEFGRRVLDALLSVERLTSQNGITYSLKLKPTAPEELTEVLSSLEGEASLPASSLQSAELRSMFDGLNLHVKVMTDAGNSPLSLKSYMAYTDAEADMGIVLQGLMTLRLQPVSVIMPKDAIDLSKQLEERFDIPSTMDPEPMAEPTEESNDVSPEPAAPLGNVRVAPAVPSPYGNCKGKTLAERMGMLRKGLCGDRK